MKISLSADVERLIAEKISSGQYRSADEVIRKGLELLERRGSETSGAPSANGTSHTAIFTTIAQDVPDADWDTVPSDLSKNLDHYLHGSDKST